MSQLNFPDNPLPNQLYPDPCPAGATQYRYDVNSGIWQIVGVATGVNPGTYGTEIIVGSFTVDVAGRLSDARNIPIRNASITETGVVQLSNSLSSISQSQALTAAAGKRLQDQIGNLNDCIVPDHSNVVAALNDLQNQSIKLQTDAMVWCGYYNALEGDISYVSLTGYRLGYRLGQELPTASNQNGGDFFIVNNPGNPYIGGDPNAPDAYFSIGDWVISETVRWSQVKTEGGEVKASDVTLLPPAPLTSRNVQGGIEQIVNLFRSPIGGATINGSKPLNPYPGQLWFNSDDGFFYIFYPDINGSQWVELGGGSGGGGGGGGDGTVYEIRTGVGLFGGPITTEGEIYLAAAFVAQDPANSTIGGIIPRTGFIYSNTTGILDVSLSGDPAGASPYVAFSQEGAYLLNQKIDSVSGVNILAGTYDAVSGTLVYVTPIALTRGFIVGQNLPPPSRSIDNFYVIVTIGGDVGPNGPGEPSQPADWWICQAEAGADPVWFLIDYQYDAVTARNVIVEPAIPGIENARNVQDALETIELQAQDRIEFIRKGSDGLTIDITPPEPTSYDGTTATITLDYASTADRGVVQLTNDFTGSSETLAITQQAAAALNAKIEALVGSSVLAGTYDSNTGKMVTVTVAGKLSGFVVGQQAPAADAVPDNYYVIVITGGGYGPPGAVLPPTGVQSGDWFIVQKDAGTAEWVCIDYDNRTVDATQVNLNPFGPITATNVQTGMEQIVGLLGDYVEDVESLNTGIVASRLGPVVELELQPATAFDLGGIFVPPNDGLNVSPAGGLFLEPASDTTLGGVKVGEGLYIEPDGTLNAVAQPAPETGSSFYPLDSIAGSFNGVLKTFSLTSSGKPISPTVGSYNLFLVVGGVLQSPDTSYVFSNGVLTFSEAPPTGATFSGRYLDAAGVVPDPAPPVVVTSGYITGVTEVGEELLYVEPTYTGYPPAIVTWEWYANDVATGVFTKGYVLTNADIGKAFSVKAILTNDSGTATDTTPSTTPVTPPGGDVTFTVELWGGKGADSNFGGDQTKGGLGAYQKVEITADGARKFKIGTLTPGATPGGQVAGGGGSVFYIDNNWMVVAGGGGGAGFTRDWSGDTTYNFQTNPGPNAQSGYSRTTTLSNGGAGQEQLNNNPPRFTWYMAGGGGGGCPGGAGGGSATSIQPGKAGGSNIRCFADSGNTSGDAAGIAYMAWVTGSSGVIGPTTCRITNKATGRYKDFGSSDTEFYIAEINGF